MPSSKWLWGWNQSLQGFPLEERIRTMQGTLDWGQGLWAGILALTLATGVTSGHFFPLSGPQSPSRGGLHDLSSARILYLEFLKPALGLWWTKLDAKGRNLLFRTWLFCCWGHPFGPLAQYRIPWEAQPTGTCSSPRVPLGGGGTHVLPRDQFHFLFLSVFWKGKDHTFYEGEVPSDGGLQFRSYSLKLHMKDSPGWPEGPKARRQIWGWEGKSGNWEGRKGLRERTHGHAWERGGIRWGHFCWRHLPGGHDVC